MLVLERWLSEHVQVEPPSRYGVWDTLTVEPGRSLTDVLRSDIPQDSDVLVVAQDGRLLAAPASEVSPHRTVAALHVATGSFALDQLGKIFVALEKSDPEAFGAAGAALGEAAAAAGGLVLEDPLTESIAKVTFSAPVWSRIDGSFQPGMVQYAPTGLRRLDLAASGSTISGQIAVKGWSVVRAHESDRAAGQELFEKLSGLFHYPLVLTVEDGKVTETKATEAGSAIAATALTEIFAAHPGHAEVTALEFGLNPAVPHLPFNSESNAVGTGKASASIHLVLGTLPLTQFEIVLDCVTSSLTALGGTTSLAGAGTALADQTPRRRMNRVIAANCGCH
ncbi:hypothetical protein [Streptomyces sp. NPDC012825]|uniref:hypothetical protein n=1 Tax=Streptomyces sp. NPDC012825 TaxID=3364851 RepID=UPI0036D0FA20